MGKGAAVFGETVLATRSISVLGYSYSLFNVSPTIVETFCPIDPWLLFTDEMLLLLDDI